MSVIKIRFYFLRSHSYPLCKSRLTHPLNPNLGIDHTQGGLQYNFIDKQKIKSANQIVQKNFGSYLRS